MNIVEPYAKLMDVPDLEAGIRLLKKIEWCGRISHRSEEAQTADSWQRFIKAVVFDHGDWSIVEHAAATVDMVVDRGITHEIVRHRLFSFTMESTRFVNYEKKMPPAFVHPDLSTIENIQIRDVIQDAWECAIRQSEDSYRVLVQRGISPQIARSVFPNALASRIITTGNLRNWRHIFLLRSTKEAHPQMRQVMIPLLEEFKSRIPILFDDIEPLARQIDNMRKPR